MSILILELTDFVVVVGVDTETVTYKPYLCSKISCNPVVQVVLPFIYIL